MKKILAMLLLCMLLCAASTMALAVTVEFTAGWYSDEEYNAGVMTPVEVTDGLLTMPACEFSPIGVNADFFGWDLDGMCYQPGETVKVSTNNTIKKVHAVWSTQNNIIFEYRQGRGKADGTTNGHVLGYRDIPTEVFGCESFGFTAPDANAKFLGWLIEGDYNIWKEPDYGDDVGWLFARAIAEDLLVQPNQQIVVSGNITLTAQWTGDESNGGNQGGDNQGGDNQGGGNQGGGNQGGDNGGNTDGGNGGNTTGGNGAAAENLPKTGDESSLAMWMALLAMTGAVLVLLRKRTYN